NAEMFPLYEAGDYAGAAALLREALERGPNPGIYYNLACMEALQGHADAAFEALEHVRGEARFKEMAAGDSDFDSLTDVPRFTSMLETWGACSGATARRRRRGERDQEPDSSQNSTSRALKPDACWAGWPAPGNVKISAPSRSESTRATSSNAGCQP